VRCEWHETAGGQHRPCGGFCVEYTDGAFDRVVYWSSRNRALTSDRECATVNPIIATRGQSQYRRRDRSEEDRAVLKVAHNNTGSASIRFARAYKRFRELDTRTDAYLKGSSYYVEIEGLSGRVSEQSRRLRFIESVPSDIPPLIGDFIRDLHSSLDHIVWELSRQDTGCPVAERSFPTLPYKRPLMTLERTDLHGKLLVGMGFAGCLERHKRQSS
jgi:hypothetical protein